MGFNNLYIRSLLISCIAAGTAVSCISPEPQPQFMKDLARGYWVQDVPGTPLVNFSPSGQVFYYIYTVSDTPGIYDACYDPSAQQYTKYAIDMPNGRICFIPDQWYDIKVLTASAFTLEDIEDHRVIKFKKIAPEAVNVMSPEEYFGKYLSERP